MLLPLLAVEIAPVTLSEIIVATLAPSRVTVAAVIIPTSKLEAVTGDNEVLECGSFVSDNLKVFADSS